MSTAASSTERPEPAEARSVVAARSSTSAPLLAFRIAGLRGRSRHRRGRRLRASSCSLTVLAAWLPAYLPDGASAAATWSRCCPARIVGVLVIAMISAAASGGGRELVPREQAVAFPVSPTTDHLGALLMAPLNIAWLLQAWALLGATAYVAGRRLGPRPGPAPPAGLAGHRDRASPRWSAGALEWLRRGRHGMWMARGWSRWSRRLVGVFLVAGDRLVPAARGEPDH